MGVVASSPDTTSTRDVYVAQYELGLTGADHTVVKVLDEHAQAELAGSSIVLFGLDHILIEALKERSGAELGGPIWLSVLDATESNTRKQPACGFIEHSFGKQRTLVVDLWMPLRDSPTVSAEGEPFTPASLGHAMATMLLAHHFSAGDHKPGDCDLGRLCQVAGPTLAHSLDSSGYGACDSRSTWCEVPGCSIISRLLYHANNCRDEDCIGCAVHRGHLEPSALFETIVKGPGATRALTLEESKKLLPECVQVMFKRVPVSDREETPPFSFRALTSSAIVLACPYLTDPDVLEVAEDSDEEAEADTTLLKRDFAAATVSCPSSNLSSASEEEKKPESEPPRIPAPPVLTAVQPKFSLTRSTSPVGLPPRSISPPDSVDIDSDSSIEGDHFDSESAFSDGRSSSRLTPTRARKVFQPRSPTVVMLKSPAAMATASGRPRSRAGLSQRGNTPTY